VVSLYVAAICFPLVFVAELPDKTMFASLVMATKGRPLQVWIGAAGAFVVHVAIAVSLGVVLFHLLPHEVLDSVVAALFLFGAVYAWHESNNADEERAARRPSKRGAILTAFVVIFLAEWGDLTQILTANLAAKYHDQLGVGLGSLLALWCVAAIAVTGGRRLTKLVPIRTVRRVTAIVLVGLAGYSAWSAAH
jgi:putative Ca2+/H+ antiporter (TMEM165/GDT1 family)